MNIFLIYTITSSLYRLPSRQRDAIITSVRPLVPLVDTLEVGEIKQAGFVYNYLAKETTQMVIGVENLE